jgi:hypothetical protein
MHQLVPHGRGQDDRTHEPCRHQRPANQQGTRAGHSRPRQDALPDDDRGHPEAPGHHGHRDDHDGDRHDAIRLFTQQAGGNRHDRGVGQDRSGSAQGIHGPATENAPAGGSAHGLDRDERCGAHGHVPIKGR